MADVASWVSKPCRCLFHITPAIPSNHFIPSSFLFSFTNTQFAPISGCFQAPLPPSSQRRLRASIAFGHAQEALSEASTLNNGKSLRAGFAYDGKSLCAGFVDGVFLLAVPVDGNLFEPGSITRSVYECEDDIHMFLEEITIAHRVIDILHGN